jgi:hypothetical protein
MKLKENEGEVTFLLRTGNDLVKNHMPVAEAENMLKAGKLTKSKIEGYVTVDNTWYFEGSEETIEKPYESNKE